MKNKYIWTVLLLWLIAILATFFILKDENAFARLAPVYLICMVGSILTVRWAQLNR